MKLYNNKIFYLIFSSFFFTAILCGWYFQDNIIENSPNYFSDSSAYYFYSALFQANAAIISIFGVFFIFRLQSYQSEIDLFKSGLIADHGRSSWPSEIIVWNGYSLEKKEDLIAKNQTNDSGSYNKAIFRQLCAWTEKERKLCTLKNTVIAPILIIAFVMILEIFSLFSANQVHQFGIKLEFYIMFTNFVLESSIVVLVVYHIIVNIKANVV